MAIIEILKSTLRTREYVEKGEAEGKSLLDAMRDGSEDGMQCFDDEIEKNIRAGVLDLETGISYSTNAGNLRLQLADMLEEQSNIPSASPALRIPPPKPGTKAPQPAFDPGMEIITFKPQPLPVFLPVKPSREYLFLSRVAQRGW